MTDRVIVHGMSLPLSDLSNDELNRLLVELARELGARKQFDAGNYAVRAAACVDVPMRRHPDREPA